ncbi:hypothetical protein B566_EDAN010632 [Ephemera danica]|nr:hypothetical protein B566_EDAN010632 [Ephemera danica]
MPLNSDVSTALQLLEGIQQSLQTCDDPKLEAQANADLNLIISVLENPVFRGIDSLGELNSQIQAHPSILPVDFELSPIGKLVLNLPPAPPGTLFDGGTFDGRTFEPDDQRVPVAKLSLSSSSGGDANSPQLFKPEGSSLGFSVVGLRSEDRGELGIYVQEIQPAGIAGRYI